MAPNSIWRKSRRIAAFTALEAIRSRFLVVLGAVFLALLLLTELAGASAVTESGQIRSALLAALLRVAAVFLVALFVVSSVAREQADKGSDAVLSLAIPRHTYYFGKLFGYLAVALCIAALAGALIALHAPLASAAMWGVSLFAELAIVVAASLLCMMTLSQVPAAIAAVAGLYLLARVMGAVQLIAHGPLRDPSAVSSSFMAHAVDALAFMLPDLYRFTDTQWLLYGAQSVSVLAPLLLQSLIYVVLLGSAGLFDLYRRNF